MKTKEEVLKGDSYLVDCFIESRNGENIFTNLKNGHVIARLENYAIIPMEKYLKIAPVEQSEQLVCPECKSNDCKTAIYTDYKECNKCYHYWEAN